MFHSDRGSQYASQPFQELLRGRGIQASMSRQGDCWITRVAETLFGSLKVERLHGLHLKLFVRPKMKCSIGCSGIPNTTSFDTQYVSPMQYEQNWARRHGALCKFNGGCEVEKAMEQ